MASNLEPTGAATSLTARRPAANNLPNFELPVPQFSTYNNVQPTKFAPLPTFNATTTTAVNTSQLLTPPSTGPGDALSPMASALTTNNPNPYNYSWPPLTTGLTPMGLGAGSASSPPPWTNTPGAIKGLFSPSIAHSLQRNSPNSPTAAGASIPPPPVPASWNPSELPPLPSTTSMNELSAPATMPSMSVQQNVMAGAYLSQNENQIQSPVSATATQASPVNNADAYSRPQSTSTAFYSHSQPVSAHQASFPPFNSSSSPIQQSPMSAPAQSSRISPAGSQSAFIPPAPANPFAPRNSYLPYSMPGMSQSQMTGPVLTNINNPNNPMGIIGLPHGMMPLGYNSGHSAHLAHQLKDALKRHVLVKGCGRNLPLLENKKVPEPSPKSESVDDDDEEEEESPIAADGGS
ncbi:hypothetical protein MMC21_006477 [Puttea exsequens]|nr:hypothetical protein [Puttea exsequens]